MRKLKLSLLSFVGLSLIFLSFTPVTYATFPGTPGKLLYTKNGTYYTSNSDGTGEQPLNAPTDYFNSPRWSPDGGKIAYEGAGSDLTARVFMMNVDGTNRQQVVSSYSFDPQWNYDGMSLYYNEYQPSQPGFDQLSRSNLDGSGKFVSMYYASGEVSPDGDKISEYSTPGNYPNIFYSSGIGLPVGSAGKGGDSVYAENSNANKATCASWSPDSTKIAFWYGPNTSTQFIAALDVVDISTKVVTSYTPGDVPNSCPVWSPDSSSVVYSGDEDASLNDNITDNAMVKFTFSSHTRVRLISNVDYVADWQAIPNSTSAYVYRFWSPKTQHHFYTSSYTEALQVLMNYPDSIWTYEGVGFSVPKNSGSCAASTNVYRFWSDQSQGHFYTTSDQERDYIISHYPTSVWRYEGVAFCSTQSTSPGAKPVYRFWSDQSQGHFYTTSDQERDYIISHYPTSVWRYEGVGFYSS